MMSEYSCPEPPEHISEWNGKSYKLNEYCEELLSRANTIRWDDWECGVHVEKSCNHAEEINEKLEKVTDLIGEIMELEEKAVKLIGEIRDATEPNYEP